MSHLLVGRRTYMRRSNKIASFGFFSRLPGCGQSLPQTAALGCGLGVGLRDSRHGWDLIQLCHERERAGASLYTIPRKRGRG